MVQKNKLVYISLAVIVLYLLPFLFLWQNSPILVHDTLEAWFPNVKVLSETETTFSSLDATIPSVMNGLPRNVLVSEFNFFVWGQTIFDLFTLYIVNLALMHVIAFVGMYFLLKVHFLKDPKHHAIAVGAALCFALLPFNPFRVLGIAAMPLVLYAFLNLKNKSATKKDWVIILLYPFFSSFFHVGIFFLSILGLLWLYDFYKTKKPNWFFLAALFLLGAISFVTEYRVLFTMFLDSSFQSHRLEFGSYPTDLVRVLGRSARTFIFGQYHAASLHYIFVFFATAAALVISLRKKILPSNLLKILVLIIAISVFAEAITGWAALEPLKAQFSILKTFNFARFTGFFPILWGLAFALSLKIIFENQKHGKQIAFFLIILQVAFLFSYTDSLVQTGGFGMLLSQEPGYAEFYSEPLFNEIDLFISQPKESYRVVSIGLVPAIAQFNGFYVLDSYQPNYSLEYKHSFRKVIEAELEKSPSLKRYFDGWGSRAYIFPAELEGNRACTKGTCQSIKNLELNTIVLKEMGVKYVFSAVEIENAEDNGFELLKVFERSDSPWKIWLYQIQ